MKTVIHTEKEVTIIIDKEEVINFIHTDLCLILGLLPHQLEITSEYLLTGADPNTTLLQLTVKKL